MLSGHFLQLFLDTLTLPAGWSRTWLSLGTGRVRVSWYRGRTQLSQALRIVSFRLSLRGPVAYFGLYPDSPLLLFFFFFGYPKINMAYLLPIQKITLSTNQSNFTFNHTTSLGEAHVLSLIHC